MRAAPLPDLRSASAVLFVCTGNICRSPMAEGVLRSLLRAAGLERQVRVDSAATHGYHVGEPPDERARHHALRRGYDIGTLRARQVARRDLEEFDLVLAMDRGHLRFLERLAGAGQRQKLHLLMQFAADCREQEVSDPYYGGPQAFERALDLIEAAARGLVEALRRGARALP